MSILRAIAAGATGLLIAGGAMMTVTAPANAAIPTVVDVGLTVIDGKFARGQEVTPTARERMTGSASDWQMVLTREI